MVLQRNFSRDSYFEKDTTLAGFELFFKKYYLYFVSMLFVIKMVLIHIWAILYHQISAEALFGFE